MISILLSASNEFQNPYFWKTLSNLKTLQESGLKLEVIVGFTSGTDGTTELLSQAKVRIIEVNTNQRAQRYNKAAQFSTCGKEDWLVLHHPRSLLDPMGLLALQTLSPRFKWGAFTHSFDFAHPVLEFTSWWSNHVRGEIKKIYYLDHCLFINRSLFEKVSGFPEIEIFEDTVLSQRLGAIGSPLRLPWKSTTSAIRFTANGIWKQSLHNQLLKCRFALGHDYRKMNEIYERGLDLN